jgi:uncharacterized protein (TIGR00251 family)
MQIKVYYLFTILSSDKMLLDYIAQIEYCPYVNDFIQIDIKVFPGASKNEITGIRDKRLCIRVCAAPEDGKANACLCEFLSKTLGCAKRDIVLIKGEKSKLKTVSIPASLENKLKEITLPVSTASLDQASSPLPWKHGNPCP